jgi:hypothetical protein
MITPETTVVYVRVDLASNRVIAVSDQVLVNRAGRPVFQVASNQGNIDYYVIEKNVSATYGVTVRPATAAERTAADAVRSANMTVSVAKTKAATAVTLKNFYDLVFISRFHARGFYTTLETLAAANYEGTDTTMLNVVKPLGIKVNMAYNEWRHVVCQPVIDTMLAGSDFGPELDNWYRNEVETELDAFLTARNFDITEFHR